MDYGKRVLIAAAFLLALGVQDRVQGEAIFVDAADDARASGEMVPLAVTAVVDLTYGSGWNLVSLPVVPDDGTVLTMFPDAISAFEFDAGYAQVDTLDACDGYWLNLTTGGTYSVAGMTLDSCMTSRSSGWSLMGVPLDTTLVADIVQDPTGNIISVFGFSGGYFQADTLAEGSGYWVNLTNSGTLTLIPDAGGAGKLLADVRREVPVTQSKIVVMAGGHAQTLQLGAAAEFMVALPPTPPAGTLDARVAVAGVPTHSVPSAVQPMDYRMQLQGSDLVLQWDIDAVDAERWQMVVDGAIHELVGVGSLNFSEPPQDLWLRYTPATPQQFALLANYPNPFNPSTTIRYELSQTSHVKLTVYDMLGQKIRDLVDLSQSGGAYSVVWDGRDGSGYQSANGVYFYEIQAGDFRSIRKMMLTK
jgi:flagellar hook capping protein FlgD